MDFILFPVIYWGSRREGENCWVSFYLTITGGHADSRAFGKQKCWNSWTIQLSVHILHQPLTQATGRCKACPLLGCDSPAVVGGPPSENQSHISGSYPRKTPAMNTSRVLLTHKMLLRCAGPTLCLLILHLHSRWDDSRALRITLASLGMAINNSVLPIEVEATWISYREKHREVPWELHSDSQRDSKLRAGDPMLWEWAP